MCNFGGSQTTQQTQNQTSTYTPNSTAMAAYNGLIPQIQKVGSTPYDPATQQQVAGLTPDQQQAFSQIRGLQGVYQPYMDQAGQLTGQAGQAVNANDIANYMSPYTQQVINSTMDQLNQRFGEQQSQLSGNAAMAGALGGNRLGVAQGVLGGEQGRTMASTIAGLENQAYGQALNQANATKAQQLAAGNQFAGLGGLAQQYGLTGAGALYGAGAAQQQQQQNINNANTANATARYMQPYQNLQYQTGLIGALGPLMGGTTNASGTSTSTATMQPGLMQYLGLGSSALGLLSDERAKANVREVGRLHDGQPIYAYNYVTGGPTQLGLLAQEVEQSHPEAVGRAPGGLKTVNYDAATADSTRPGMATGGLVMPPLMQFGAPASAGQGPGDMNSMYSLGQKARAGLSKLFDGMGQTNNNGWGANFETSGGSPWSNFQAGLSNLGSALGFADGGLVEDDALPLALRQLAPRPVSQPNPAPTPALGDVEARPGMSPDLMTPSSEKLSRTLGELWRRYGPELDTRRGGFFEAVQQPQAAPPPAVAPAQSAPAAQPSPVPEDTTPTAVKTFRVNPFETTVEAQGHPVVSSVVDEMRAAGLSEAAQRGILANVQHESGFDPSLRHPDQPKWGGEAHYAHGLYQEGGAEWNKYEAWLKANHPGADWTDARLQTRFLMENLQQNYPSVWKAMNEGTPEEAAKAFLTGYLKPSAENVQRRFAAYDQGIPDLKAFLEGGYTSPRGSGVTPSEGGISQPQTAAPTPDALGALLSRLSQPAPDKGGLIKRLTGYDFNPLGLDANERMALIAGGLAMAGAPGAATGVNTYLGAQAQERQQQLEGLKLAMQAQQIAQQMQMQAAPSPVSITDKNGIAFTMQRNPLTGELTAPTLPGGATGAPGESGDAIESEARAVAAYDRPLPLRTDPRSLAIERRAREINPSLDAAEFGARQKLKNSFTSGPDAKEIQSYDTVMGHLTSAYQAVDALGNTRSSLLNTPYNAARNQLSTDYQRTRAKIDTALDRAIHEVNKATTGEKIGVQEAKAWHDKLSADSSPDTMKATLSEFADLIKSRMDASARKYNEGFKLNPEDKNYKTVNNMLSPQSLAQYKALIGAEAPQQQVTSGRPANKTDAELLQEANTLIQRGAPADKIKAQLEAWGVKH